MRTDAGVPHVSEQAGLAEALLEMSRKGLGLTAVVNAKHEPVGIFTDGDLRRAFEQNVNVMTAKILDVMHVNPSTIHQDQLAIAAVEIMEQRKINGLLVVDDAGRLVGALNMHDLLLAKVV